MGALSIIVLPTTIVSLTRSGVDGNVPTWHSRELVSVLKTWAADANVKYARFSLRIFGSILPSRGVAFVKSRGKATGTRPSSRARK